MARELIKRDILVVSCVCGNHALEVAGLTYKGLSGMPARGSGKFVKVLTSHLCSVSAQDAGRISILITAVADALGVDTSDIPVAVTAPGWMEQKATMDGIFALAYGLHTYLSPVPSITGGSELTEFLTDSTEDVAGGRVVVDNNQKRLPKL